MLGKGHPSTRSVQPRRAQTKWVASLSVAVAYLLGSLVFTEFRGVFEFNPDEGNNLVKALLLEHGHTFARGIWSDQPPLFAYALHGCFEVWGTSIGVARTLVLVTSALLVFALHQSVLEFSERRAGAVAAHLGAAIAVFGLLLAARFAPLRVSVMIGLPSIALASLAMWAALRGSFAEDPASSRRRWQVAAGALLAVSLGIKLFTLFVVPIVYATVLVPSFREHRSSGVRRLFYDSLPFAAGFLPMLLLVFSPVFSPSAFAELFRSHLAAERGYERASTLFGLLSLDAPIYCGALAAVLVLARDRRWDAAPWLGWLVLALAALGAHNPVWLHHSLLLVVPASALLGLGAAALFARGFMARHALLACGLAAMMTVVLAITANARLRRVVHPGPRHESRRDKAALAAIENAAVAPGSMITARQIFAFYLQRPIPPQLSVTSLKRLHTGGLAEDELERLAASGEAQLVLMSDRWPAELRDRVRRSMGVRYERFYEDPLNGELEVWRRRADE